MPTYEYQCEKCGYTFDEFQSISAEPLKNCKKEGCDGTVKRLFSPGAGFIFKGSGFYITDYRSDSYKKAASGDSASSSSSASSAASSAPASGSSTSGSTSSSSSSSTPGK
jgi:putative FmdB family regulatory protein